MKKKKKPPRNPKTRTKKQPCMSSMFTVWLMTSITDDCFEQRSLGGKYSFSQRSIMPIWCNRVISRLKRFRYGELIGRTIEICSSMNSSVLKAKSQLSVFKYSRLITYCRLERQSMYTNLPKKKTREIKDGPNGKKSFPGSFTLSKSYLGSLRVNNKIRNVESDKKRGNDKWVVSTLLKY